MGAPIFTNNNQINTVRLQNARLANQLNIRPNQLIQPAPSQSQTSIILPSQAKVQSSNILPSTSIIQPNRPIATAIHQPGTTVPQLATLPSGLTGMKIIISFYSKMSNIIF